MAHGVDTLPPSNKHELVTD